MFDIAFSEMLVIGVVALIVIGPERLPGVARTVGHIIGRLQKYVRDLREDIDKEIRLDELKKLQQEVSETASEIERSIHEKMAQVSKEFNEIKDMGQHGFDNMLSSADPKEQLSLNKVSVDEAQQNPSQIQDQAEIQHETEIQAKIHVEEQGQVLVQTLAENQYPEAKQPQSQIQTQVQTQEYNNEVDLNNESKSEVKK